MKNCNSMLITQKKIAEYVGVTPGVVSLALSNHPSVAAKTRARISQAAIELGYSSSSNRGARALAARRHGRRVRNNHLALVFPSVSAAQFDLRSEPYFIPLFEGAEMEAHRRGAEVSWCPSRAGVLPSIIASGEVDGVVSIFATSDQRLELAKLSGPVVAINVHDTFLNAIVPDDRDGARQAVQHLVGLGHERIAYIGQPPIFDVGISRLEGYRDAMMAHGVERTAEFEETSIEHLMGESVREDTVVALQRLLDRNLDFTGLICYNDTIAMEAIDYLQLMGLRVPCDISVVGFDDTSTRYRFVPAITSVSAPGLAMGKRAVELIFELLSEQDEQPAPARQEGRAGIAPRCIHEVFPIELIVRESTGPTNLLRRDLVPVAASVTGNDIKYYAITAQALSCP